MLHEVDEAVIVVAFWGDGATESLGLRKPWRSLKIVCNLESGACNPSEIEKLLELGSGVQVRSDFRLHGKVYSTPSGIVLGSSNASTNGLVVEGMANFGWSEANIFSNDSGLLAQVRVWCEDRFQSAKDVTQLDLLAAQEAWDKRKATSLAVSWPTKDLIQSFRDCSDGSYDKVKFVQWARKATSEAAEAFDSARETDPTLEGADYYEGWDGEMEVGDWLIDYHIFRANAEFTGYWKVVDIKDELTIVRQHEAVELPSLGALKINDATVKRIGKMIHASARSLAKKEKVTRFVTMVKELDALAPEG